jgi:hypothetical protein
MVTIALLGLFALALGLVASIAAAQTPLPADGDWVVKDTTVLMGVGVVLHGNLIVSPTGRLTLIDVDLLFAQSRVAPRLDVQPSGELVMRDVDGDPSTTSDATNVTSINDVVGVPLVFEAGSKVLVDCCILKWISIEVMTDGATISNTTLQESPYGIKFVDCAGRLERTSVTSPRRPGVSVEGGSLVMDRCEVRDGARDGVNVGEDANAWLRNCTLTGNNGTGLKVNGSTAVVEDCDLSHNLVELDLWYALGGRVERCSIHDNDAAEGRGLVANCTRQLTVVGCNFTRIDGDAVVLDGVVEFKDSIIDACKRGALVVDGAITITRCMFSSNEVGTSVVGRGGQEVVFEGCTFVGSKYDGVVVGAPGGGIVRAMMIDCNFERNGRNGVRIEDGGRCVLVDPRLSGNGVHGVNCSKDGTVEWRVETYSCATNDSSLLRGNVTIIPWSTLELTNATMTFLYNASFVYGVRVRGGALVLSDLDGDPATDLDGSLLRTEEISKSEYTAAHVTVTDGGRLEARCSRFQGIPITVEGARCELRDCELAGPATVGLTLGNTSGPSILHGCEFFGFQYCVHAWNGHLDIDDCAFHACDIGIEASSCDGLSVRGSTFSSRLKGLDVMGSSGLVLQDVVIVDADVGAAAFDVDDLRVIGSSISGCALDGLRLTRCDATIASCTMRDIGGSGVAATTSSVSIDGLDIRRCGGSGLHASSSTVSAVSLRANETDGPAAWLVGGTTKLTDSYLDSLGAISLLAEADAAVQCYNSTVEVLRVVARDSAVVELFHQVRVTVTLMDGRALPVSLRIVLMTALGSEAHNAPLGPSASTGWVWLEQVAIRPDGHEWHSPYTAEVSFAGRSVTKTFEVECRTDVTFELPHLLMASISIEEEVDEGVETTLDGTASFSWPSELTVLEWDIGYDGVFVPDGWGGRLWWTFDRDGAHKVALRVRDGTGGSALAVVVVAVRDLGPTASIIPPPPGEIGEDERIELDGRVTWVADPVDLITWDLGDGRVVAGTHPIVSWPRAGTYVVTLTVVDMDGSRATASGVMTVVNLPPVAVVPSLRLVVGKHVPFELDASRSSDTPSDMPSLRYEWVVEGVGTFAGDRPTVTIDAVGEYHVTLRVTDMDGASSTAAMSVVVVNSPPLVGRLDDIAMRQTDRPIELPLVRKVTDPDDDARNITVRASTSRPELVSVTVRRQDDGTYVLTVTPVGTGGAVGRAVVTVTATDGSGASAQGAFNVTLLTVPEVQPEGKPAWVVPSLVLSLIMVLVAVVLLLSWARSRRDGPSDEVQ